MCEVARKGNEMTGMQINEEPYENLASRGDRLIARIVDIVISMVIALPVMKYLGVWELVGQKSGIPVDIALKLSFSGIIIFFILNGYLLNFYGQTIGKKLVGIRISTLDGKKPDFWPLIGKRYLPLWVVMYFPAGNLFSIVDPLFIFRKDKRCVHDLIADTIVVNADTVKVVDSANDKTS